MREEDAFWMLCTIAEKLVPEYYDKALLGSLVDQHIFNNLVTNNLPELGAALDKVSFSILSNNHLVGNTT